MTKRAFLTQLLVAFLVAVGAAEEATCANPQELMNAVESWKTATKHYEGCATERLTCHKELKEAQETAHLMENCRKSVQAFEQMLKTQEAEVEKTKTINHNETSELRDQLSKSSRTIEERDALLEERSTLLKSSTEYQKSLQVNLAAKEEELKLASSTCALELKKLEDNTEKLEKDKGAVERRLKADVERLMNEVDELATSKPAGYALSVDQLRQAGLGLAAVFSASAKAGTEMALTSEQRAWMEEQLEALRENAELLLTLGQEQASTYTRRLSIEIAPHLESVRPYYETAMTAADEWSRVVLFPRLHAAVSFIAETTNNAIDRVATKVSENDASSAALIPPTLGDRMLLFTALVTSMYAMWFVFRLSLRILCLPFRCLFCRCGRRKQYTDVEKATQPRSRARGMRPGGETMVEPNEISNENAKANKKGRGK